MAKSGKAKPQSSKPVSVPPPSVPPRDFLVRDTNSNAAPAWLPKAFWGVALFGLLMLVGLSFGSGINADDKFQVDYSQKLINYYGTFGQDSSALKVPDGNMHLYGGFFEVLTGFENKALGFEPGTLAYHNVRHVSSAIFGWLAILCAGLLAVRIAGWQAGLVTLVIMFCSPRFVGDSLMNPKDIPFAAGYIMALYNMVALLDALPQTLRRWNLTGLALGLGIALGTRAGGLLPFAMLFMFGGLHFMLKNGLFKAFSDRNALKKYAIAILVAAAAGYVIALLFWPFALQAPLKNPFLALSKFADLEVRIRVLFEGNNMMSDKAPRDYAVKWIAYTIPLAALLGFVGSVFLLPRLLRRYNPLWVVLVLFAAIFPVFYVIYKDSVLHDGWRHLTFAFPPLCVAAALFWNELAQWFAPKKALVYGTFGVMGLLLADAAAYIFMNPKVPYTYFNPVIGGIEGAYGKFETDYWGVSTRQGLEWLESQGIIGPNMQETVVIATNMFYSTRQLTMKYGDKVKVKYLKWEKRCDDAWDYALYPTRFLDGSALKKGFWPPDNAVHTFSAGGVPILAVLKDNGKNCSLGFAAMKVGDNATAISRLRAETDNVPDNEVAWVGLAQAYMGADSLEQGKAAADKCLEINPNDDQAMNLIGIYWLNKEDVSKAKSQFDLAVKRNPGNAGAWYYLAIIAQSQGDNQTALNNVMKSIQAVPNFRPSYELGARIHEASGNVEAATRFREALKQLK
jgi:tetratricopeptide (TPR) repeat protein